VRVTGWRLLLLGAALTAAGCGGGASECDQPRLATPLDRSVTGTIIGTVGFDGEPPPMAALSFGGESGCAAQHAGPVLAGDALVKEGRVQNAFVYVKEGLGERVFAVPTEPVTVDQKGCVYEPHVAAVRTCQPVVFVNSDALLHNVHGTPRLSSPWNFSMSAPGSRRTVRISRPEVMVEVRCDVHPWMRAYLGVLDHPYGAVTGADGAFTLGDVPPGDYVVASWHERFGSREARVTLGAKATVRLTFTYGGAP
jgi:plastocyanin